MEDKNDESAIQKIQLKFAPSGVKISSQAKEHMRQVISVYGKKDGVKMWMLAPNYSHANANEPPTGAIVVFDEVAPMFPDAFSTVNLMTAGTSFVRLKKTADGRPVTSAFLERPEVRRALQRVGVAVGDRQLPVAPVSLECRDAKTNADTREWTPALGGTGAYMGVFRSSVETDSSNHDEYYLGVRSSAPNVSRELVRWLERVKEENSRGNTTSTNITASEFANSKTVAYAMMAGRRNRNRMLAAAAAAMGVQIATRRDRAAYLSDEQRAAGRELPRMALPDIENLSHTVRHLPSRGVVVYYNNTTPTDSKIEGVVVSRSARLGPVLHQGHRMAGDWAGWHNDESFHAYPTDTGRSDSIRDLARQREANARRDDIFSWSGDDWNAQLVSGYYSQQSPSFMSGVEGLGRPSHLNTRSLKPVRVVLVPTRRPHISSIPAKSPSSSSAPGKR